MARTCSGSSSAAMRLIEMDSHSVQAWTSINSPRGLNWYLFLLFFMVNPMGFIPALQAESRSPAEYRSRWRDHKQYGQWLRFCTPESMFMLDTNAPQFSQWKSPKVEAW